jgi:sugar-specific transcriptional regulator TrmB
MKLGKPIKYIAIDPNDIIIRVKDQIKEKTESKITSLENIKGEAIFDELNLLYTQGITKVDSTTLSSSMKGRDSIYAQLKSMIESAEKDVIIVTSEEGVVRKLKKFKNLFSRVNNKGVKIRIAAPLNNLDKNLISNVANFANMRDVGDFDARFCAVDGKEVLFMVADDVNTHEAYDTAVWVNSPFFSEAFISMFDSMWNKLPEMK